MSTREKWRRVTAADPCPVCGKPDWCAWTPGGQRLKCERVASAPAGMRLIRVKDGGGVFELDEGDARRGKQRQSKGQGKGKDRDRKQFKPRRGPSDLPTAPPSPAPAPAGHFEEHHRAFLAAITADAVRELANELGVRPNALEMLGIGWATRAQVGELKASGQGWSENYPHGAYSFPERDGRGRLVGFSFRTLDGRKGGPSAQSGARRGLIIPTNLGEAPGTVYVVEGATDVAALVSLGIPCIGRPSNSAGAEMIAELLDGRLLEIVGERDQKEDGRWPGRDGARSVASQIAAKTGNLEIWTLPPEGFKDVREWLKAKVNAGLQLDDEQAKIAAGKELIEALETNSQVVEGTPATVTEQVVRLAEEAYRFAVSSEGRAFAVARDGPNVAIWLASDAFKQSLRRLAREHLSITPRAAQVADVVEQLAGAAHEQPREQLHLRTASVGDGLVIDLGTPDGSAIIISNGQRQLVNRSPVTFRRTELTESLPIPVPGGRIEELLEHINADSASRTLVLGWLLAAFDPSVPRPILILRGEQGTGKSTLARLLISLCDPSAAPLQSVPISQEDWAVTLAGSSVIVLDNISAIAAWLADQICKACTGDALVRRKRFTDDERIVLRFKRAIILTSIDLGVVRGDMLQRSLLIDLEPIPPGRRRPESQLDSGWADQRTKLFGVVLDLLAKVRAALPLLPPMELSRMADFDRVLAAMDRVLGINALEAYRQQHTHIAGELLEEDSVAQALFAVFPPGSDVVLPMGAVLKRLRALANGRGVPPSPRALSAAIRRLVPLLRDEGLEITIPPGTDKTRRYRFRRQCEPTAQTARPPEPDGFGPEAGHSAPGGAPDNRLGRPPDNSPPSGKPPPPV